MSRETIASIVTPLGEGGIGVIEVSGPRSLEIVNAVFRGKNKRDLRTAESKSLHYGKIYLNERIVDEVIIHILRKKDSFTGEDLVEVNCHGGIQAVKKTLECIVFAGAKKVNWQELADRSYLNDKIDLIQKEAYREIPQAKTRLSAKVLLDQYNGSLSSCLEKLVKRLECENNINRHMIMYIHDRLKEIGKTAAFGCALTSPKRVIIAGRPNVGKSTLINSLLRVERTIVHEEPGTTRDAVDILVSIRGIPFTIVDTAGIRETEDTVEKLGVAEARNQLRKADKIVYILDNSNPIENEDRELIESIMGISEDYPTHNDAHKNHLIFVINKIDLPQKLDVSLLEIEHSFPLCRISALESKGLSDLEETLTAEFSDYIQYTPERAIIFTNRQKKHLSRAFGISEDCIRFIQEGKDFLYHVSKIKQELLRCME
ncbi:MAG: GTP-binding protein [Candidatus Scalindua sp.]|nr:GTP-binding protein [Candidatus Scalindua sp.]